MPSHYDVLGVARGASLGAIRVAYRELARVEHPDVKPNADASRMVQINLAYRVLSDPASRAAYDRALDQAEARAGGSHPAGSQRAAASARVGEHAAPGSEAVDASSSTRTRASWRDASMGSSRAPPGEQTPSAADGGRVSASTRTSSRHDSGSAAVGGEHASAAVSGNTPVREHTSSRRRLVRWLTGTAYAAMVVATIIGARRLAAPGGDASSSESTPSARRPTPERPALPRAPRDPCPAIQCPPGATEHQELANGACKRWCTDAHGTTLASSTSRAITSPTAEPLDPQQLARQRLTCRSQPGRAPTCSLGGGDIELGALPAAAISGWRVVEAQGAAPVASGTHCELQVLPVPAAISGDIPYNCRLNLRCGPVIYGGGSAGFGLCDVASGVLRGAVDPLAAASDGDPALVLDAVKGRLVVADATWRLSLTALMPPPKGPTSD